LLVATGIAGSCLGTTFLFGKTLMLLQDLAVARFRACGRESTGTFLGEEHQPQQTPRTEIHAGARSHGFLPRRRHDARQRRVRLCSSLVETRQGAVPRLWQRAGSNRSVALTQLLQKKSAPR